MEAFSKQNFKIEGEQGIARRSDVTHRRQSDAGGTAYRAATYRMRLKRQRGHTGHPLSECDRQTDGRTDRSVILCPRTEQGRI